MKLIIFICVILLTEKVIGQQTVKVQYPDSSNAVFNSSGRYLFIEKGTSNPSQVNSNTSTAIKYATLEVGINKDQNGTFNRPVQNLPKRYFTQEQPIPMPNAILKKVKENHL